MVVIVTERERQTDRESQREMDHPSQNGCIGGCLMFFLLQPFIAFKSSSVGPHVLVGSSLLFVMAFLDSILLANCPDQMTTFTGAYPDIYNTALHICLVR